MFSLENLTSGLLQCTATDLLTYGVKCTDAVCIQSVCVAWQFQPVLERNILQCTFSIRIQLLLLQNSSQPLTKNLVKDNLKDICIPL